MTVHPPEPATEEDWLGNRRPQLQSYLPDGHRIHIPSGRQFNEATAMNLLQESLKAEAAYVAALRETAAAEDALKIAQVAEADSELQATGAADALAEFIRKAAEL